MNSINLSLSGIQAAFARQEVSAHNVANINTEGYQAERFGQSTSPDGGVQTDVTATNTSPGSPRGSNVDVAGEMINQMQSKHSLQANISAFKTADTMLGEILDLQG